jgi:hypothetical protein
MPLPVVLKEYDPIFGDSYYKLRVRLLSRENRHPILDVRWYDHRKKEWTTRGISLPLQSLESLESTLSLFLTESSQLIKQFNEEKKK